MIGVQLEDVGGGLEEGWTMVGIQLEEGWRMEKGGRMDGELKEKMNEVKTDEIIKRTNQDEL